MNIRGKYLRLLPIIVLILSAESIYKSVYARDKNKLTDTLTFHSEEEKAAIEDFLRGQRDYFQLFYYATKKDNLVNARTFEQKYYKEIEKYKVNPYQGMKPSKLSKTIYKDIHKQYFTKYEYSIIFSDIFDNGSYNCVTASALYSICFEDLGLDYDIRLLPQHVYIILYPETEAIKIETTDPVQGLFIPNSRFIRQYVNFLKEQKYITEEDYNLKNEEDLFQEYYYAHETITIDNLVGVQYYNSGLTYFMDEDYETAYAQFEKALLFYPSDRIIFLSKLSLQNLISLSGMNSLEDLKLLVKLLKFEVTQLEKDLIVELFRQFTYNMLTQKGDLENYTKGHQYIQSQVKDSVLLEEFKYTAHFESGRFYYRTGMAEKSERYFVDAFLIRPDNIDAQSALIEILTYKMTYKSAEEVIQSIRNYYENYEELRKNNAFTSLYASIILTAVSQSYGLNNPVKGKNYLDQFESIFDDDLEISSNLISDAYISAAVYYFGKGNTSLSKRYINKGLEYSPGNFQLLQLKLSL